MLNCANSVPTFMERIKPGDETLVHDFEMSAFIGMTGQKRVATEKNTSSRSKIAGHYFLLNIQFLKKFTINTLSHAFKPIFEARFPLQYR